MTLKATSKTKDPSLNLEQVRLECKDMAKARAKISAGVAIIPVPFLDVAIDVAMLSKFLPEISERFGLVDTSVNEAERKEQLTDRHQGRGRPCCHS